MLKRFQYYSREGIKWTDWYEWHSDLKPKYQLERHPKLLNEYKEEQFMEEYERIEKEESLEAEEIFKQLRDKG